MPAPGPKDRAFQVIDVRDAAAFALRCAEENFQGVWNVTGPVLRFCDALDAVATVAGSSPEWVWLSEDLIKDAGIEPWVDIPLMAPLDPRFRHVLEVSTAKARAAGLVCRPLEETLGPLLAWDRERRAAALQCGMTSAQEAALLG